jgi:predicted acetyltransferase
MDVPLMTILLEDAWTAREPGAFFRNVWPMYVHEISAFDSGFYRLDSEGRWLPDLVGDWLTAVTPARNLREIRAADDPGQPFQRAHVIRIGPTRMGFVCVSARPFLYMPEGVDYELAELFILHPYRGAGTAQESVSAVLDRYPGRWHLRAIHDNARAISFWRRTLAELRLEDLAEKQEEGEVVWKFRTHP